MQCFSGWFMVSFTLPHATLWCHHSRQRTVSLFGSFMIIKLKSTEKCDEFQFNTISIQFLVSKKLNTHLIEQLNLRLNEGYCVEKWKIAFPSVSESQSDFYFLESFSNLSMTWSVISLFGLWQINQPFSQ